MSSTRHYFLRSYDMGDAEPGRDVCGVVESSFFSDEDGTGIKFERTMSMGHWYWRTYLFGVWMHLQWDDVVRRFGPVQAVVSKELS